MSVNELSDYEIMAPVGSRESLACARKSGDSTAVANSLHSIGTACYLLGMKDSAYRYTEMSIPYAKYVRDDFRPYYLNRIGAFIFNTINDVRRSVGIGQSTIRTTRTRIRQKLKRGSE